MVRAWPLRVVLVAAGTLALLPAGARAQRAAPWQAPGVVLVDQVMPPPASVVQGSVRFVPGEAATQTRIGIGLPVRGRWLLTAGVGQGRRLGGFSHDAFGAGVQAVLPTSGAVRAGPRLALTVPIRRADALPGDHAAEVEAALPVQWQIGRVLLAGVAGMAGQFGMAAAGAPGSPVVRGTAMHWRAAVGVHARVGSALTLRADAGLNDAQHLTTGGLIGMSASTLVGLGATLRVPLEHRTLLPFTTVIVRRQEADTRTILQFGAAAFLH